MPTLMRWLHDEAMCTRLTAAAAAICGIDPDQIDMVMPVIIDALEVGIVV